MPRAGGEPAPAKLKGLPAVAVMEAGRRSEECTGRWKRKRSQDGNVARSCLDTLKPPCTRTTAEKAAEKAERITAGYVNLHVAAAEMMKGKDNAA